MGAQFTSKNIVEAFSTETVTITRQIASGTIGQYTTSTIYTGSADLQEVSGSVYLNASGVVEQIDALLFLDPVSGVLPAIEVGDVVNGLGTTFNVVQVATYNYQPQHLELALKRGPLGYKGKT